MRSIAVVLAFVAVGFGLLAATQLSGGIADIPRHWWSTMAFGAPALAAAAFWVAGVRERS